MKKISFLGLHLVCLLFALRSAAQSPMADTIITRILDSVSVKARMVNTDKNSLPDIAGTYLYAGKKTEVISLMQSDADISNKTGRQVFAKIPGIFVYDMDGSGNQINIATRGLDPHRGWEFNIRKDGTLTNSDMYGYPASHFSMPLESIERIEIVRGTGSLQYGAQFGGMLNYVSKKADTSRPFSYESINTIGSYQLASTYQSIGGTIGKFSYQAYIYRKSRDGYRDFDHTDASAESITLSYKFSPRLSVMANWSRSAYTYRMPGPLNDSMFRANPREATRSRNYFNPDIHIPSAVVNWDLTQATKIQLSFSAVLGKRNSVMFDKLANIGDTINLATGKYNNRQVDMDAFNSKTAEVRLLHDYKTGKTTSSLVAGLQVMDNDLHRTQLGVGTTGSDYTMEILNNQWGRDLHFITHNLAFFAENKLQLSPKLSLTAGIRVEDGRTDMRGVINYYPGSKIPVTVSHHFPLAGGGFQYLLRNDQKIYGSFAQSYRPMIFKDLIPASLYEKVDSLIKDVKGYNAELGWKGTKKGWNWDITAYLLEEKNRFGTLALTDYSGNTYLYRTNIGNSLNIGIELFVEKVVVTQKTYSISIFTSSCLQRARYYDAVVKSGNQNVSVSGNHVESAPDFTTRNGISFKSNKLRLSLLYSYTAATFSDALNTSMPIPGTGASGLVPSYGITDLNAGLIFSKKIELRASLNNIFNKQYFTKRPTFYPAPGIWPSDGRNATLSLCVRL